MSTRLRISAAVVVLAAVAAITAGLVTSKGSGARDQKRVATPAASTTRITIGRSTGRPFPAGFLGLSLEYQAIEPYAGRDPNAVDPVFVQLIRNLAQGNPAALRIGGDSTDWTWWPVPGLTKPGGVSITLDNRWLGVMRSLATEVNSKPILGINLEANSRAIATKEASEFVKGLGASRIGAFELGNEPELYPVFKWGRSGVLGRPRGYNFSDFMGEVSRFGHALPASIPLAGPATGSVKWMAPLGTFLAGEPRVSVGTLHRYPLQTCFVARSEPKFPTIGHLLAPYSSSRLAGSVRRLAATAHAHGRPVRIDEFNTDSCGAAPGVSNAFASALWVLDTLFEMKRVGVDGVDVHTYPGATYELFTFKQSRQGWQGFVAPEYYGMLMFAQAAQAGSRLTRVTTSHKSAQLHVWATRARDGTLRITLINESLSHPQSVAIDAPSNASASLESLRAPHVASTTGVTLGGQTFGKSTSTGLLKGRSTTSTLRPRGNSYTVRLPPASAALVTVPAPTH